MSDMTQTSITSAVTAVLEPILDDLGLELYDCEFAGGVLRVTVDTPTGGERGVDLEELSLVTRLLGRELDHRDLVPGRYTLEVTSPGLERSLRTPAHFAREIGKQVTVRLREQTDGRRRLAGTLVASDELTATVATDDGDVVVELARIDKARTVFVWEANPKPGKGPSRRSNKNATPNRTASAVSSEPSSAAEEARAS